MVLVWDVTYPDTLAPSYSSCASREAGIVAEEAERRKKVKYTLIETSHCFIPIAVEMLGVFGLEARQFVKDLGSRIEDTTLEPLSTYYIYETENCGCNTAGHLGDLAPLGLCPRLVATLSGSYIVLVIYY